LPYAAKPTVDATYFTETPTELVFDFRDRLVGSATQAYIADFKAKFRARYRYGELIDEGADSDDEYAPREPGMTVRMLFGAHDRHAMTHRLSGRVIEMLLDNGPNVSYALEFTNTNLHGEIPEAFVSIDGGDQWVRSLRFSDTDLTDADVDDLMEVIMSRITGMELLRIEGRQHITPIGVGHMNNAMVRKVRAVAHYGGGEAPRSVQYIPETLAESSDVQAMIDAINDIKL
jgi:hypothetical protein